MVVVVVVVLRQRETMAGWGQRRPCRQPMQATTGIFGCVQTELRISDVSVR